MDELLGILVLDAGPAKTAALTAWVQSLYPIAKDRPILVGGSAVELFTGGAYVTGDFDFVGLVPDSVGKALKKEGFRKEGRHWIHEEGQIFLEFPSSNLAEGEQAVERKFENRKILIVSPEDLIVDRLSAWSHWSSAVDGVNAYLLYRSLKRELDGARLKTRAADAEVMPGYKAVVSLFNKWKGKTPDKKEFDEWTRKIP